MGYKYETMIGLQELRIYTSHNCAKICLSSDNKLKYIDYRSRGYIILLYFSFPLKQAGSFVRPTKTLKIILHCLEMFIRTNRTICKVMIAPYYILRYNYNVSDRKIGVAILI